MGSDVHVSSTVDGSVAVISLDRPDKLNAFTYSMLGQLRGAVDDAVADERVVGIVITGAGRGFCAGLDLGDLARTAAGEVGTSDPTRDPDELPALFSYLLQVPKPVVAAVNGACAGGGFVLAMMCDLRFAGDESALFTTTFSKRGLVAEHGTSWLLPRLVGTGRALDLLWSARKLDAAEAYRIGFVDRVVADDRLVAEACAYIEDLAADVSPRSLAIMKEEVYRGLSQPLDVALRQVAVEIDESMRHPDSTEGVQSFVERRPPKFERWSSPAP